MERVRHSLSHLLAMAVLEKFPRAKLGIGPVIENGFYYDFDIQITDHDLAALENRMKELVKKNLKFKKETVTLGQAKKIFKSQPYKLELAEEIKKTKKTITIFKACEKSPDSPLFVDLCAGPHVKSTKEINPSGFKLVKIAGAYWRGNEKNPQLQRVYGLAFENKEALTDYLKKAEEAEKRDHRKLGKELNLFSFHDVAPGMPFFHPKGSIVYNELKNFWIEAQKEFDYDMILCPSMLDVSIWKKSGHWDHYKDDMYFLKTEKGEKEFALRPMDCPGAILIYNNSLKSYRDLPLRYSEPGLITRKEKSGQLNGLFRVQQFVQDDAHIFLAENQIESEIKKVIALVDKIYRPFGMKHKAYLSTRPDDYMGDPKTWKKAEAALTKILKEIYGKNYGVKEKDGAFYGPKIDYQLNDSLERTWQCATIQLDFQMPEKFDCRYIDRSGKEKRPVMIHRTIMGSFERFMGILIEHYAGAFPLWLAPVQIAILPVSVKHSDYGQKIDRLLKEASVRAEMPDLNETLGKRIREAETQKIPYILVVGDNEIKSGTVSVRKRGEGDMGLKATHEFVSLIKKEIEERR